MTGVAFVQSMLGALGAVMALGAVALALVETGQGSGAGTFRAWQVRRWRDLAETPWGAIPRHACRELIGGIDRAVVRGLATAAEGPLVTVLVIGLAFVAIPVAALANALQGGSPFLVLYWLTLFAALAVLNFTGEVRRLGPLNAALALYLGVSLVLVLPVYVLESLTDRMIHTVFGHAVLGSVLVFPLWYCAAFGAVLLGDALIPGARSFAPSGRRPPAVAAAYRFAAAVPVAFVLAFFALLAGHLAEQVPPPLRAWQPLVATVVCSALALPATVAIVGGVLRRGGAALTAGLVASLAVAAGLSWLSLYAGWLATPRARSAADVTAALLGRTAEGTVHLGPDVWVMHLPFLPVLAFLAWITVAWMAKAVAAASRGLGAAPAAAGRPYLLSGALLGAVAAVVWTIAAVL